MTLSLPRRDVAKQFFTSQRQTTRHHVLLTSIVMRKNIIGMWVVKLDTGVVSK